MIGKIKKWLCCAYAVLRKGVRNMILAAKASLSGESAKVKKKSPIKFLLHVAGHSTWWEGFCRLLVVALIWMMAAMMLLVLPVVWLISSSPLTSIMLGGLLLLLLASILYFAWGDDMDDYLLGSQGERAVAYVLDQLGRPNWRIFHDFQISKESGNIDHIVVCPNGVFCIETKTLRKDSSETRKLRFDGEQIFRGDFSLPKNPVPKTKSKAAQLRNFLREKEVTSVDFVMPVIIYPGWEFAEDSVNSNDVIVGRGKILFSLQNRSVKSGLNPDDISKIAKVIEEKNKIPLDE